ncbi:MAG: glucose/arabinose dehydrogenase [Halioglobus sp.]|jgi:glucose/arabinose dehydrogenase
MTRFRMYFPKAVNLNILFIALLCGAPQVNAHPGFLQQFDSQYPASVSSQAGCATCHAAASGGRPWNAYGRDLLANGGSVGANGDLSPALLLVESLNSDAIAGDNITEIQAGTQPGWCDPLTAGCGNQIYNADGSNAGNGIPPAGLVLDDDTNSVPEPNIQVTPPSLSFGPVLIGQSKSLNVNVVNTGLLDLTLSAVASGAPYTIDTFPAGVLSAGDSTLATLSYSPQAEALDNGVLSLNSNDPDSPSVIVDLNGEGVFELPDPMGVCPVGNRVINPIPTPITTGFQAVNFEVVADGFVNPLLGVVPQGETGRLFVVDQPGQIWAVNLGTGSKSLFLDLSSRLVELGLFGIDYDERGLLGVVFAPDYFSSGLLYTYQSEDPDLPADFSTMPSGFLPDHQSVIVEWQVVAPMSPFAVVNPSSAREILRIDQPQFNHNGGSMVFGPDNLLYITLGDGGGADDQGDDGDNIGHSDIGNGQDISNILGSIIRIDPRGTNAPNGQYGIPADNPFVDAQQFLLGEVGGEAGCVDGACDEIYAYGFRNSWRASFDMQGNNAFLVADVGQNDVEEVDIVHAGGNYGWRIKDGAFCFDPNGIESGFVTDAEFGGVPEIIDPVAQYDHDEGISITGGFVYRGSAIPSLQGHYVFGDWAPSFVDPLPGRLFYLQASELTGGPGEAPTAVMEFLLPHSPNGVGTKINGFGQDGNGELYVIGSESGLLTGLTGKVQKIVPATLPPGC